MNLANAQHYIVKTITKLSLWLVLFLGVQFVIVSAGRVQGDSMLPTLESGQRFVVWKAGYLVHAPRRFDIVQTIDPQQPERLIVKRVIALPGETIVFDNGEVIVRDAAGKEIVIDEAYLSPETLTMLPVGSVVQTTVPSHHYFVLGDNRGNSFDSRYFGPVHRRYINGQVIQL